MAQMYQTTHDHMRVHQNAKHGKWTTRAGATGGFVAGLVLLAAEMITTWISTGDPFYPLRVVGAILLAETPAAIDAAGIVLGGIVYFAYVILLGIIVAAIVASASMFNTSRGKIVATGAIAGAIIWFINFFIIATSVNATYLYDANMLWQLILHTLAYGVVLGYMLDATPPKDL